MYTQADVITVHTPYRSHSKMPLQIMEKTLRAMNISENFVRDSFWKRKGLRGVDNPGTSASEVSIAYIRKTRRIRRLIQSRSCWEWTPSPVACLAVPLQPQEGYRGTK